MNTFADSPSIPVPPPGARSNLAVRPEVQELKFTLHRKLLDRINLESLAAIESDHVRKEVQEALLSLMDDEPTLLTSAEREQLSIEVLDEVFGLGPL